MNELEKLYYGLYQSKEIVSPYIVHVSRSFEGLAIQEVRLRLHDNNSDFNAVVIITNPDNDNDFRVKIKDEDTGYSDYNYVKRDGDFIPLLRKSIKETIENCCPKVYYIFYPGGK